MRNRRDSKGSCGEECRYRRLYAGSQDSLNDMASKQTATLARVAALREGLTNLMRQHFTQQYTETERQLGHKIGSAREQDTVLLALMDGYIRTLLMQTNSNAYNPDMVALREALADAGVSVTPGADARAMALAVRAAKQLLPSPVPAPGSAPTGKKQTFPTGTPPVVESVAPPGQPTMAAQPVAQQTPQGDGGGGLDSVFDAGLDEVPWDPDPADYAYDDPGSEGDAEWGLTDLFSDDTPQPAPATPAAPSAPVTQVPQPPIPAPVEQQPATPAPEPEPEPEPVPAQERVTVTTPPPVTAEPAPVADTAKPARTTNSALRPQMFPASSMPSGGKKKGAKKSAPKKPRVSASAPGEPSAPAQEGVATERFQELYDLVAEPRPAFISDLIAAVGSPGLVRAWENDFEDLGTKSPVRVITARQHHRERGSLIIPYAPNLREKLAQNKNSAWATALDDTGQQSRLRGARLYEVAVLIHKYGNQIASFNLEKSVLRARLTLPQGLTGIVMWVGGGSPSGGAREDLLAAVGEMTRERLELLAVLTHEAGPRAVEQLAGLVAPEASSQKWEPTMPVIAAQSWQFAEDGQSSVVGVL